jgi:hypothetical protein
MGFNYKKNLSLIVIDLNQYSFRVHNFTYRSTVQQNDASSSSWNKAQLFE